RQLRLTQPSDLEWARLARELCRPFAAHPEAHPVPELVRFFFASRADAEHSLDALQSSESSPGGSEERVRERLLAELPRVAELLRRLAFLSECPLMVARAGRAESWMGHRRAHRRAVYLRGALPEAGRPIVLDHDGAALLALWPLAQVAPPIPGAAEELF